MLAIALEDDLKIYKAIMCLNKNLITVLSYFEQGERYDIKRLSIDRILNKEHYGKILKNIFYGKICMKCASKDSPRSLFNFGK